MTGMLQHLGVNVADVGLVLVGWALAWGSSMIGATVKFIFRASDGKQHVFEE